MRMFSKKMVSGLAVGAAVAFSGADTAQADFLLTAADVQANQVPGQFGAINSPLVDKNFIDLTAGRTYTNTYGVVNGNTLNVRTVVSGFLSNIGSPNANPIGGPVNEINQIAIFAVIDGTVNTTTGTASYSTGTIGAFRNTTGAPLEADNPSTWSFFTDGSEAFATWTLAAPANIVTDVGFGVNFPGFDASVVNTSSVNLAEPNQTQGRFLFLESSVAGAAPGDDFISIVNNLINNGPGVQNGVAVGALSNPNTSVADSLVQAEGIFITTEDDFQTGLGGTIDGVDLAKLNAVGLWGAGSLAGNPGVGFATGLGIAALSDFNLFAAPSVTGDFIAISDPDVFPGVLSAVPEPATALLGLFGLAALAARRRQRA